MDFMGRNKVSWGQADLKSDVYKAKAAAIPSQRLAAASHVQPFAHIIIYASAKAK